MGQQKKTSKWHFWVDRGGTFTDIVALTPNKELVVEKLLSRSPLYEDSIVEGIKRLCSKFNSDYSSDSIAEIRVGTTVATNAFLERKGVPTALVTTLGFGDALEIRQQNRPHLFALDIKKTPPLYSFVTEVLERTLASGEIQTPLDKEIARFELQRLKDLGAQAITISFLNASSNPQNEIEAGEIAREIGFERISLGHQTSTLPKFIARTETAVIDAYLSPILHSYTERLQRELGFSDIQFMQSHGGLCRAPLFDGHKALLSGPAGGLVGAVHICKKLGHDKIIGFDMGGTSTDVFISTGQFPIDHEPLFLGLNLQTPMLDIHTVAAGGGSILRADGERLLVGPESAGAQPGPACYGNGGPLTVTDANLFLGRLSVSSFPPIFGPQQDQPLDIEVVREKFEALAIELGTKPKPLARSFLEVAVETMAQAVRKISVEKGHNPRDFTLCCFGGAAAQIAGLVAERLGIKKILIHSFSSVLSAYGMGLAQETLRFRSSHNGCTSFEDLENQARKMWPAEESQFLEFQHYFHMQPAGSDYSFEISAQDEAHAEKQFQKEHQRIFGWLPTEAPRLTALSIEARRPRDSDALTGAPAHSSRQIQTLQGPKTQTIPHSCLVVEAGWLATEHEAYWVLENKNQCTTEVNAGAELEVFYQRFQAIAEEMGYVLKNTSASVNIKERLDFSCALFTAEAELIANAPHIPVHLGSMSECVRAVKDKFLDQMQEGDAFIGNSPLEGGTHLPDVTVVSPVFFNGQVTFYVASRGHHADIGGVAPGSMPSQSQKLTEEGVIIKLQPLARANVFLSKEISDVLLATSHPVRNLDKNIHDLRAQWAANLKGCAALQELLENSYEKTMKLSQRILSFSEEKLTDVLSNFTHGQAEVALENHRKIKVSLNYQGEKLVIDFNGTSKSDSSNFHAPKAVVKAAVLYVLRCLVNENIPLNDGLARNLKLVLPCDSLIHPPDGAAIVAGNVETSQALCDVLLMAFGQLAHSQGTMNNLSFGDSTYQYYETISGGTGAGPEHPGASAVQSHMTNSRMTDPEVFEQRFPVIVENFSRRLGSGGFGKYRGGDGTYRRIHFLQSLQVDMLSQRREIPPLGLNNGDPGLAGINRLDRNDASQNLAACFQLQIQPGDTLAIETPGGGGSGLNQDKPKNIVFAYGSNLDPLQIRRRCPSIKPLRRAILPHHEISFAWFSPIRKGGVADIRVCQGETVWGLIFSISDDDLLQLDEFEGGYERVKKDVFTDDGQAWSAWIYDANDKSPHIPPTLTYWWQVYKGAYLLNAPKAYLEKLKKLLHSPG